MKNLSELAKALNITEEDICNEMAQLTALSESIAPLDTEKPLDRARRMIESTIERFFKLPKHLFTDSTS